jgi:hypothetical protein
MKETGTCSLCGSKYEHFGNNPEPLKSFDERCCDDCNAEWVIPARLGRLTEHQVKTLKQG